MGARGTVPRREDDLSRPRSRKGGEVLPVTKGSLRPVTIPNPDPEWHATARMIWDSLATSGQSDFYQDSDWAYAYLVCGETSEYLKRSYRSAQMFQTICSAMTALCLTEGDRRRVRIELTQPEEKTETAGVIALADYRAALKKAA